MAAADAREFLEIVAGRRRFVLTTHVHPDGDAIGSEIALARFLRGGGAEVRLINPDTTPELLSFLDSKGEIEVYAPAVHDPAISNAEVVVMLDNSAPQRLEAMAEAIRASAALKVCIDHHPEPDPLWDFLMVRLDAPCTGYLVHEVIKAAGAPLDRESADALYAALVSDTGRFRFGNTTAAAFRAATELVEAGADAAGVYAHLSENLSAGFLRLSGDLLAEMELRREGRLILLRARADLIERRGAQGEDLAEVLNQALKLGTGRIAALFRETRPGVTKVSLRSKGQFDVNRLARRHGGGGYRNASGVVLQVDLEQAVAQLLPDLEQLALGE